MRGVGFGLIVGFNAAVDRIKHELRAMLHVDGIHTVRAIPVVVGIAVCGNAAFGRKSGARKDHSKQPATNLWTTRASQGKKTLTNPYDRSLIALS